MFGWGFSCYNSRDNKEVASQFNKEQSQLSLAPTLLILQVIEGLHKWDPNQDIAKGLQ